MKSSKIPVWTAVACLALCGADWPHFRGSGSGSISTSTLPTTWSVENQENIAWQADLPGRGVSSPITVGGQVIVTCAEGNKQDRLHVVSFDAKSGKRNWQRQFWATGRTATHPSSSVAAPTPASDGKRIFAFYSSNDLVCLDLQGNLLWYRGLAFDFPKAGNDVGMSSSPIVVGETVVVQIENQGDSFATGLNTADGTTRWRIDRDPRANWASPIAVPSLGNNKAAVLLQSPNSGLTAHDPVSGEQLWKYESQCSSIPSPLISGNSLLVSSNGLTKLKFSAESNQPELAWTSNKLRPSSASPLIYQGRIFTVNTGILKCGDINDGKLLWQIRLQGKYWATPVIANGHLYAINQDGDAKVVSLDGEKGKIIGEGKFGETVQGSPAVGDDALFVRSDKHLWKVASP